MSKLSKKQLTIMKKHSKHHTSKHMEMMRKLMIKGLSFKEAHRETQKKVGD